MANLFLDWWKWKERQMEKPLVSDWSRRTEEEERRKKQEREEELEKGKKMLKLPIGKKLLKLGACNSTKSCKARSPIQSVKMRGPHDAANLPEPSQILLRDGMNHLSLEVEGARVWVDHWVSVCICDNEMLTHEGFKLKFEYFKRDLICKCKAIGVDICPFPRYSLWPTTLECGQSELAELLRRDGDEGKVLVQSMDFESIEQDICPFRRPTLWQRGQSELVELLRRDGDEGKVLVQFVLVVLPNTVLMRDDLDYGFKDISLFCKDNGIIFIECASSCVMTLSEGYMHFIAKNIKHQADYLACLKKTGADSEINDDVQSGGENGDGGSEMKKTGADSEIDDVQSGAENGDGGSEMKKTGADSEIDDVQSGGESGDGGSEMEQEQIQIQRSMKLLDVHASGSPNVSTQDELALGSPNVSTQEDEPASRSPSVSTQEDEPASGSPNVSDDDTEEGLDKEEQEQIQIQRSMKLLDVHASGSPNVSTQDELALGSPNVSTQEDESASRSPSVSAQEDEPASGSPNVSDDDTEEGLDKEQGGSEHQKSTQHRDESEYVLPKVTGSPNVSTQEDEPASGFPNVSTQEDEPALGSPNVSDADTQEGLDKEQGGSEHQKSTQHRESIDCSALQVNEKGNVKSWACISFSTNEKETIKFLQELLKTCIGMGMGFYPMAAWCDHVKPCSSTDVEDTLWHMHDKISEVFSVRGKEIGLLLVILPDKRVGDEIYGKSEKVCEKLGFVYHCCSPKDARNPSKMYLENSACEINNKVLRRCDAARNFVMPFSAKDDPPTVVFGAHIFRDSNISTVSVASTIDWPVSSRYNCIVDQQPCKEITIKNLYNEDKVRESMVRCSLLMFVSKTKIVPRRIIFFRNGVDEGQLSFILSQEIEAIRKACTSIFTGMLPITYVVVGQAGSAVGEDSCSMKFEFSCCHQVAGEIRNVTYRVLHDENKYDPDDFRSLCTNLCTNRVRWAQPEVSMAPPAYYAYIAASRAHTHFAE